LGVVPGLVWALFIRERDKPHRAHDWFVPFVARRLLGQQLLLLPRVEALLQRRARHLLPQRLRLPCREDSVISFSLDDFAQRNHLLFSIFSGASPRPSPRMSFRSFPLLNLPRFRGHPNEPEYSQGECFMDKASTGGQAHTSFLYP